MPALVLGNFRRFVAINGAFEVDLTGHVNARPPCRISALSGGQMDFILAANRGRGWAFDHALHRPIATHPFRIVRQAGRRDSRRRAPKPTSWLRDHGIAVGGRTLAERARALVAVADPASCVRLEQAARVVEGWGRGERL